MLPDSNTHGTRSEDDIRIEGPQQLSNQNSPVVGALTASIRAFTYQISSMYLRTPVKLFRPSRFDYMAYTRVLLFGTEDNDGKKGTKGFATGNTTLAQPEKYNFFKHSSIAMLVQAVKKHGWHYIPDKVLPPIVANSFTGIVLYTSYLTTLNAFTKNDVYKIREGVNVFEPSFWDTFRAGFVAGGFQSLVAAPIDAIYTRSSAAEVLSQNHENLWRYGIYKLRNVGLGGVFAGFGLSLVKESMGFAFYFSTFEFIKNQAFHSSVAFINEFRRFKYHYLGFLFKKEPQNFFDENAKFYVLRSSFILMGGASAALILQTIQYPLSKVQQIHLSRLEALDYYNLKIPEYKTPIYNESKSHFIKNSERYPKFLRKTIHKVNSVVFYGKYWKARILTNPFLNVYYKSYLDTFKTILAIQKKRNQTWLQWSYSGFTKNVVTMIPATSVCLLVFEIARVRLSDNLERAILN